MSSIHSAEPKAKGKVLVVLSGCHTIALQKKDGREVEKETGFFLKELAQPLIQITEAGYGSVFASPEGKQPKMDPMSESAIWFLGNWAEKNRQLEFVKSLGSSLHSPHALSTISNSDLESFTGILIPGGHSPMGDLGTDKDLGRILNHFHEAHKPTAAICHGPIALLSTKLDSPEGKFAYKGYKVTCFSNKEELSVELLWGARLHKKVEDALKEEGAEVEVASVPMMPKIVQDRELVSGEGPSSAWKFGGVFVKMLDDVSSTKEGIAAQN